MERITAPARLQSMETVALPKQVRERWRPPDTGRLKVNSNGSVRATQGAAATAYYGCGSTYHTRVFIEAQSTKYECISDPLFIEILTCIDAMKMAVEMSAPLVIVDTDSGRGVPVESGRR